MESGFKYAKLTLDEPRAIYYAGQLLCGNIECELSQPLSFTVVNVNFFGKANVKWTECETEEYNGVKRKKEVVHQGHEEYFNVTQIVCGGNGISELPRGVHKIPFKFQIPHNAPSSFNGEKGEVLYTITAFIDYPDPRVQREELVKEFEVVAPLDLNKDEDVKHPVALEFEEYYSCCCSSSPMSLVVSLPASGFVPGQAIPITITADNKTSVEVKKITFLLVQKECYRSQVPSSEYYPPEEILESIQTGPILSNTKRQFSYDLTVPDMVAPNLDNCSIIDVGYFIKVIIKLSGCNDDVTDETEISIGLVPLTTLLNFAQYTHPMTDSLPNGPIPKEAPKNDGLNTEMPHQNANYTNTNIGFLNPMVGSVASHSNPASPYPNAAAPYPNSAAPYPNAAAPYPNAAAPYPNSAAPYPNSMAPYPNSAAPFPTQAIPYPNSAPNPPYPMGLSPIVTPYPTGMTNSSPFNPSAPPS